ncbi:DUF6879 family protein [Streptomyces sp. SID2888]|uniref:DUF6879 family protein n=1 Tax=Streptomyces sp. SID2888 TaxID=2690256 RepID=UPI001371B50E|nr:DUF6879 family protein [Streptomyces sp. SID2888]MYV48232.1 hypothetical protein [Streptomyces sp. SID2888]
MPQNVPSFAELLDRATESAVHLEMRDSYGVAGEADAFAHWQATGDVDDDPESPYWAPWTALVRSAIMRGVTVRRARIVSEPVSEYIRYEHAGTGVNVAAGEEVRWLPRRRASDIALPGNDFWLFDQRVIRWNHFDGEGASAGQDVSEDPAAAQLCAAAFTAVWDRAIPHDEYKIS